MAKPILLYTAIWEDTAEDITNQILDYKKDEPVELWLNSPGGSVTAGWSIIAALDQIQNDVNVTVMGDASSMAFIMLLFADNVTAYDSSNFLIHRAASWFEDIMNEDELKDIESRNKVIRKKLEARIDENKFIEVTGKSFDDIFSMDDRLDVKLNAQQAKKIGLIDKIVKLDVAKRKEIESRYFNDIAALATPKKINSNTNINKMGKLTDLIFGEKDPILLASIGETQVAYGKIEVGAKVKATGKDESLVSGTFEAEEKQITVVENEITAVKDVDRKGQEISALKAEIKELKDNQLTATEVADVIVKNNEKYEARIEVLEKTLSDAKLTASKPTLPEGEFKDEKVQPVGDKEYRIKKAIEAKAAEKQAKRSSIIKNGGN